METRAGTLLEAARSKNPKTSEQAKEVLANYGDPVALRRHINESATAAEMEGCGPILLALLVIGIGMALLVPLTGMHSFGFLIGLPLVLCAGGLLGWSSYRNACARTEALLDILERKNTPWAVPILCLALHQRVFRPMAERKLRLLLPQVEEEHVARFRAAECELMVGALEGRYGLAVPDWRNLDLVKGIVRVLGLSAFGPAIHKIRGTYDWRNRGKEKFVEYWAVAKEAANNIQKRIEEQTENQKLLRAAEFDEQSALLRSAPDPAMPPNELLRPAEQEEP